MAENPRIRISIRYNQSLIVEFAHDEIPPLEARTNVTPVSLGEFRDKVADGLNQLRRWSVGKDVFVDVRNACGLLRKFIEIQAGNSSQLFHHADRYRIQDWLAKACPLWRTSGNDAYCAPVVQITSSVDHLLPLEFLPLFDAMPPKETEDNLARLIGMAARFLVFSSNVHRTLLDNVGKTSPEKLDNGDKLRIRFFRHAATDAARDGQRFLSTSNDIELRGPWPDGPLPKAQFITDLASQLWQGMAIPADGPGTTDHIQYFACHCDTRQRNSDDYSLRLAYDRRLPWGAETIVTLRDLHQAFGSFASRVDVKQLPLVFLNACGGSRMTPTSVTSFPLFFLNNDNCGVIATETPVQDDFAKLIAREFYEQLLRVANCGQALFRARWLLLKIKHNPQGMLYSFYGSPDLRVRNVPRR